MAAKKPKIITLLSDFGSSDTFAGTMKGVILSIAPDCRIVDLTHEIPPQDIYRASLSLSFTYEYFPKNTVHAAVVDPGVGSRRRNICIKAGGHFFVGPDNGIFSHVLIKEKRAMAYALTNTKYFLKNAGSTFDGRDVFAPAAAALTKGVPVSRMGKRVNNPVKLEIPRPVKKGNKIYGQVEMADRFGNLITNITQTDLSSLKGGKRNIGLMIGTRKGIRVVKSYSDAFRSAVLALVNSHERLEISVRNGSAQKRLKARPGTRVVLGSYIGR